MSKKINFIYNNNLDHHKVQQIGYGNSEFKFYMLAKSLSDNGLNITIYNNSKINDKLDNIYYKKYTDIFNNIIVNNGDIFIIMRDYKAAAELSNIYLNNKILLWTGDYLAYDSLKIDIDILKKVANKNNILIVAVSKFHKNNIYNYFKENINAEIKNIIYIHNCVFTEYFMKKEFIINKNKIIYASAWAKGLKKIISLFDKLIIDFPELKLCLMRPKYDEENVNNSDIKELNEIIKTKEYIEVLNTVNSKKEYSKIIGSSLCTISSEFPETFGNVFAESYYLKTPVLATNIICGLHEFINNEHVCDFNNYDEVKEIIRRFQENRPSVSLDSHFLDYNIINMWLVILNSI